jgi:cytoskeletal protein CcmA (bactofilin family)
MEDDQQATIIGESILINGTLRGDEDLTVLGRVEGFLNLSKTLLVAENGIVKAEVAVNNAVVSGIVVGNITATDCIHITSSGRILGDIRARRVILNAGARVRGAIEVGSSAAATQLSQARLTDDAESGSLPALLQVPSSVQSSLAERRSLAPQGFGQADRSTDPTTVNYQNASQAAMALAVTKKKVVMKKRS